MEIYLQQQLVARNGAVYKSQILRKNLVEQETAQRGAYISGDYASVRHRLCAAHGNSRLQLDIAVLVCQNRLVYVLKEASLSLDTRSFLCQVIDTQDHIL